MIRIDVPNARFAYYVTYSGGYALVLAYNSRQAMSALRKLGFEPYKVERA